MTEQRITLLLWVKNGETELRGRRGMDKDTIIMLYELKKKAQPKRILGRGSNVSETDRELQALQNVVCKLIDIIERQIKS